MSQPSATLFSCVLDEDPYFTAQAFLWLNCLIDLQRVPPPHIFVHYTGIRNGDFRRWLESKQVNLIRVAPYDSRSPHCNKLRQLATFAGKSFGHVALMDCDTAWVGGAPLPLPCSTAVAAKPVDFAMPTEAQLSRIFREAGLGEPDWVTLPPPAPGGRTDRNNCNGGLYLLAPAIVGPLDAAWRKWAEWCLDRRHLFGEFAVHVDQVGFALALRELGARAAHLGIAWNYPIHIGDAGGRMPDVAPEIIHFHRQLGPHLKLSRIGVAAADRAIEQLNRHVERWLSADLVNSMFWDVRYRTAPELGSGIGSRDEALAAKRALLAEALRGFERKAVVDLGCGDIEVTRLLPLETYIGLEVAQSAIEIAASKRPDWAFRHVANPDAALPPGDAVLCIDVLIHQKRRGDFEQLIGNLTAATRERLVVGGYDEPPRFTSELTAFHRPLTEALHDTGAFRDIRIVGRYRDCCLIVADRR